MKKDKNYTYPDHLTGEERQEIGAFYTPKKLAIEMARSLNYISGKKVLDPCVGKGNLLQAMKDVHGVPNELLYGVDIDAEAIKFCIEKFPGGHFQVGDVLKDDIVSKTFWQKPPFESFADYKRTLIKNHTFTFKAVDKKYADIIKNEKFKETMAKNIKRMVNLEIEGDFVFHELITYTVYAKESNKFHIYRSKKFIIEVS